MLEELDVAGSPAYLSCEGRVQAGDPKWEASQALPDVPYAEYSKLIGPDGLRVDSPEQVGPAWDQALAAQRPFILDMVTDAPGVGSGRRPAWPRT